MKILFIKNKKYPSKLFIQKKNQLESYFKHQAIEIGFLDEPLDIVSESVEASITGLKFDFSHVNPAGDRFFIPENVKEKVIGLVEKDKYDCVVFFDKPTVKINGTILPYTDFYGIYNNTEFIYVVPNIDKNEILHEVMHAIVNILSKLGWIKKYQDQIDETLVNGKLEKYYHNDDPLHTDGNYSKTFALVKPFIKNIKTRTSRNMVVSKLIELKTKLVDMMALPEEDEVYKPKHFSTKEVNGLDVKLVEILDKAREIAGIPFIINSGLRTPEHNKKVGGVADSAHLKGLAVDLRARNGQEIYTIVQACMQVGIKRIGINWEKKFCHVDIDYSKPNPTIYKY
jgi:uncharacterized protein YcbK (DUF882 family)